MTLSDREKELIQITFTQVASQADNAAELFYTRLFEMAPDTQPLFANTDMRKQGRKLMQTIAMAVGAIHHLETLIPAVEALGKRHISYGVRKEQYADVGEALIWALEQSLGDQFTAEVKTAWINIYTILADVATSVYEQPSNDQTSESVEAVI
jgi:nitric oxide dioxygenase